jgi:hypothetical protein
MDLDNLAKYLVILHVLQCDTVLQSHAASNLEETRRIASGACYPVCGPNALPSRKRVKSRSYELTRRAKTRSMLELHNLREALRSRFLGQPKHS